VGGCVSFAAHGGTFATGIIVPVGATVTFEDPTFSACNELSWGYNVGTGDTELGAKVYGCFTQTDADVTVGPFATAVVLRVYLTDETCASTTYYSDGDHANVTQLTASSWQVDMLPVYQAVTEEVGRRLGIATELVVETSYESCEKDENEVCFVCSLPYVTWERRGLDLAVPVAAPVLQGDRYEGRPIYFSDVIVHRDSPLRSFLDLRGRSWAYNEPLSHSGYGITRYHLAQLGETNGFFGKVVEVGLVAQMRLDGARANAELAGDLVVGAPSTTRETIAVSRGEGIVARRHVNDGGSGLQVTAGSQVRSSPRAS
jgi:ABC-type phosphate/phosphonate transport system substrate-binding protein